MTLSSATATRRIASSSTIPTSSPSSTTRSGCSEASAARAASRMIVVELHRRALGRVVRPRVAHHPLQRQHVRAGDVGGEVGDVVVRRCAHDLVGRPDLDDLAVAQDHDPVTQLERLGQVVGDEHHRLADLVVQPDDLVLHVATDQGVERRERLVEEQDLRVAGERAGQPDALLHPAGELVGVVLLVAGEPDEVDHLARLGPALLLAHAADLEPVGDVVDHLLVGQQAEVLEHHRHVVAAQRRAAATPRRR